MDSQPLDEDGTPVGATATDERRDSLINDGVNEIWSIPKGEVHFDASSVRSEFDVNFLARMNHGLQPDFEHSSRCVRLSGNPDFQEGHLPVSSNLQAEAQRLEHHPTIHEQQSLEIQDQSHKLSRQTLCSGERESRKITQQKTSSSPDPQPRSWDATRSQLPVERVSQQQQNRDKTQSDLSQTPQSPHP